MVQRSDLDRVWEPGTIGSLTIPNRVYFGAHAPAFQPDRYADYISARAEGGSGLIITGSTSVSKQTRWDGGIPAWTDDAIAGWRQLAEAAHRHGSMIFTQLYHTGAIDDGTLDIYDRYAPLAPSQVANPMMGKVPKEMDGADIVRIVDDFAEAAVRAQKAGIDGVELHGGHGYLIQQFFSPRTNRRTDGYGGDIRRRAQFAIDIAQAIRERCGTDFALGIKLG